MISSRFLARAACVVAILALGIAIYECVQNRRNVQLAENRQHELNAEIQSLKVRLKIQSKLTQASEEDGAKLLNEIDSTVASIKGTPDMKPEVPITREMVEARYKQAKELAASGHVEEALKGFLWCYDIGMVQISAYAGVRQSFLLSDIVKLGQTYPPALAALNERRDADEKRMLASANDFDAAMSFAGINSAMKDMDRNLRFYDQLPEDSPLRPAFGYHVYQKLAETGRYSDAAQAMPYSRMKSMFETLSEERKLPDSIKNQDEIRQMERDHVVSTTASYIEVLAGAGDLVHAKTLAAQLLAYDGSAKTRSILQQHATKAGQPQLLVTPTAP